MSQRPTTHLLKHTLGWLLSGRTALIVRITLGAVFLYAGIIKLNDVHGFAKVMGNYGILPTPALLPAAAIMAAAEAVAGLGLILNIRGSLSIITGLILLFAVVLSYGIHIGLDADCGCFGPEDPESRWQSHMGAALARDGILLAGAVYLYARSRLNSALNAKFSEKNLEVTT